MNKNKEKEQKPVIIGKASFIDFNSFVSWCETPEADKFFSVENLWTGLLYNLQGKISSVNVSDLFDKSQAKDRYGFDTRHRNYIEPLTKYIDYINTFSSPDMPLSFDLLYEHPKFDIIAFAEKQFLIPAGNLNKTLFKDYSDISIGSLQAQAYLDLSQTDGNTLIPLNSALNQMSLDSQTACLETKRGELAQIEGDMDDVKNARVGDLAVMQAEIDRMVAELEAKKESMLEVLNAKKAELDLEKRRLEQELYILESEIYSIRCFLGEVVDFIQLRSGVSAPVEQPVVLFQKMRFLDEELGKIASIYDFDFEEHKLFEKLLKNREDVVETLCPNNKSVTLVRVSRTGKAYGYYDTNYGPMLGEYDVYHGKKIGILIRNGENLYMGWTDDEKINIPEDMFYTPEEAKVVSSDEAAETATSIKEAVSRYFVFSILQGALADGKLFSLPVNAKVKFGQPSDYIVYSAADAWIVDYKYGSFKDILNKVNSKISVGDDVLALESLDDGHFSSWCGARNVCERDRNYSNRTRDVHLSDGEIYKINLIEEDNYNDLCYYVSLKKPGNIGEYIYRNGGYYKRKREAHANFRVFDGEFINLTYMNSVWLQYVITTRNLGGSGRMNHFAEVIRYLNKALKFVREREKTELELIEKYVPCISSVSDWPVKLSEWKLALGVRNITDYQAKRFAKTLNNEQEA